MPQSSIDGCWNPYEARPGHNDRLWITASAGGVCRDRRRAEASLRQPGTSSAMATQPAGGSLQISSLRRKRLGLAWLMEPLSSRQGQSQRKPAKAFTWRVRSASTRSSRTAAHQAQSEGEAEGRGGGRASPEDGKDRRPGPGGTVMPVMLLGVTAAPPKRACPPLSVSGYAAGDRPVRVAKLELGVVRPERRHRGRVFKPFLQGQVVSGN